VLANVTATGASAAIGFALAQFQERVKGRAIARIEDDE
jgi:hypothetical protein